MRALSITENLDMWSNESKLMEIRKMVSPSTPLTELEFSFLVQLGKATQLNPFMREIWVVKYRRRNRDSGKFEELPAQIFIGRDGYRKAAQRQKDYEYHQVNAVYSNDKFQIIDDIIHHTYGFSNRGELLGAYCIVKRKSAERQTYVMATMKEYNQKQSLWNDKPETMIKKVAEAQALRQAFQEVLAGTYSDAELEPEKSQEPGFTIVSGNSQTDKLNSLLDEQVVDAEITQPKIAYVAGDASLSISSAQIKQIEQLIIQKQLNEERVNKAFSLYGIETLDELNDAQARKFIFQLEKV